MAGGVFTQPPSKSAVQMSLLFQVAVPQSGPIHAFVIATVPHLYSTCNYSKFTGWAVIGLEGFDEMHSGNRPVSDQMTELTKKTTDHIQRLGFLADDKLAPLVDGQQSLLLLRLHCNKPHGWSRDGCFSFRGAAAASVARVAASASARARALPVLGSEPPSEQMQHPFRNACRGQSRTAQTG